MPIFQNIHLLEKELNSLSPSSRPSFFLILGKEEEERKKSLNSLFHFFVPNEKERKQSLMSFDGAKCDEEALFSALSSFSFFVKRHFICIQQADKLPKTTQEKLIEEIPRLGSGFILLLSASHLLKTNLLWKLAETKGMILDHPALKSWEKEKKMAEWIAQEVTKQGQTISLDLCQSLVKMTNGDSAVLRQELDKLLCFSIGRKEITLKDLHSICIRTPNETLWQLSEAIFQRQGAFACSIAKSLLNEGEALLVLLRQIRSQFQTNYEIALMLNQGKNGHDITEVFPFLRGQFLERNLTQAKNYGLDSFRKGILAIDATEMRIKNGDFDDQLLLELLMIKLTERV